MSAPWDQQEALAALLTAAGLPTSPEVPEVKTPPFRYVLASDPWISSGQSIGSWQVHYRVICVTQKGTNVVQMSELADMVRAVILALKGTPFKVDAEAVDAPAAMTSGAGVTLGAAVNITAGISRAAFEEEA